MQTQFLLADKLTLIFYFMAVILFGAYFRKKSSTSSGFMIADGGLPSWAVGLSILGTFVSSITFLAYPGQAYNANWDVFLFSLTLPPACPKVRSSYSRLPNHCRKGPRCKIHEAGGNGIPLSRHPGGSHSPVEKDKTPDL